MVLGQGTHAVSAEAAIEQAYNRGETDEYIAPTIIVENDKPVASVNEHDVIFFFNARSDRARQITKAFVQPEFESHNPGAFKRKVVIHESRFVAMTDFGPDLPGIFTAFPSPDIPNAMAKAIGEAYDQLYISETEKYAHVTYFVNGGYAEPINGEDRELIRSPKQYSYADRPQMSAAKITKRVTSYLKKHRYNFVCINYPNADMVGHTGNYTAALKAVSILDAEVKKVVDTTLALGGTVFITADHGNAEEMIDRDTGEMMTEHTTNPVPFIMISKHEKQTLNHGALCDVAPTLLAYMHLPAPKEMTGKSLL
jgi:2,3-bisphosphoglycerate-independent phosphoglycerate mutase